MAQFKNDEVVEVQLEIKDGAIIEYARDNIKVSDIYSDDEIIEYITLQLDPDDVFGKEGMQEWCEAWAEDYGYVKKED